MTTFLNEYNDELKTDADYDSMMMEYTLYINLISEEYSNNPDIDTETIDEAIRQILIYTQEYNYYCNIAECYLLPHKLMMTKINEFFTNRTPIFESYRTYCGVKLCKKERMVVISYIDGWTDVSAELKYSALKQMESFVYNPMYMSPYHDYVVVVPLHQACLRIRAFFEYGIPVNASTDNLNN